MDKLAERFERAYTGAVFDVLRAMGHPDCVLPPTLRPLNVDHKIAGPVFTMEGNVRPGIAVHDTLLAWTGFLSKAPAGSIVICQPHDSAYAHLGELSSETLKFREIKGYVVDGGCRDSAFIQKLGFPVYCRYYTPNDIAGRWMVERLGEPIVIGRVRIHAGDYALADRDGIVIIPTALAEEVATRTEEVLSKENLVRKAILEGVDPQAAYLQHGKF